MFGCARAIDCSDPRVPFAPLNLHVPPETISSNGFTMTWAAPLDDGGDPVREYEVAFTMWTALQGATWLGTFLFFFCPRTRSLSSRKSVQRCVLTSGGRRRSVQADKLMRRTDAPVLFLRVSNLPPRTLFSNLSVRAVNALGPGDWSKEFDEVVTTGVGHTLQALLGLRRIVCCTHCETSHVTRAFLVRVCVVLVCVCVCVCARVCESSAH